MCNESCLEFIVLNTPRSEVHGKRILEVGSRDFGARRIIEALSPCEYIGVDIRPGPGVDRVIPAEKLVQTFGENSFDLVISTEMVEHVKDWRAAFSAMKQVCRPEGKILVTTRSRGFPYHSGPKDYWRYCFHDMRAIFGDCRIDVLAEDRKEPGVLVKVTKEVGYKEVDTSGIALFSVVAGRRIVNLEDSELRRLSSRLRVSVGRLLQLVAISIQRLRTALAYR